MFIWRRGAERDQGYRSTSFNPSQIAWDTSSNAVVIAAYDVPDFTGESHHNWTISLSLREIQKMIVAASTAIGGDNSASVASEMAPALTSLLRLATEAAKDLIAKMPGATGGSLEPPVAS